MKQTWEP